MRTFLLVNMVGLLLLLASSNTNLRAESAPDFTLQRIDNQQAVTLSMQRGKVVYVDFWASWCAPCTTSLPALQALHDDLHKLGFEVIAINLDDSIAQARQFINPLNISYSVVFDPDKHTPRNYQIKGMPTAFLIDREGAIRSTHTGFRAGDEHKLKQQIQQLLQEPTP